jgi:hypothetical protein
VTNQGETITDAILRSARPPISSGNIFANLINTTWGDSPTKRKSFNFIVPYLEEPRHWLPGLDSRRFWEYKALLNRRGCLRSSSRKSMRGRD